MTKMPVLLDIVNEDSFFVELDSEKFTEGKAEIKELFKGDEKPAEFTIFCFYKDRKMILDNEKVSVSNPLFSMYVWSCFQIFKATLNFHSQYGLPLTITAQKKPQIEHSDPEFISKIVADAIKLANMESTSEYGSLLTPAPPSSSFKSTRFNLADNYKTPRRLFQHVT